MCWRRKTFQETSLLAARPTSPRPTSSTWRGPGRESCPSGRVSIRQLSIYTKGVILASGLKHLALSFHLMAHLLQLNVTKSTKKRHLVPSQKKLRLRTGRKASTVRLKNSTRIPEPTENAGVFIYYLNKGHRQTGYNNSSCNV